MRDRRGHRRKCLRGLAILFETFCSFAGRLVEPYFFSVTVIAGDSCGLTHHVQGSNTGDRLVGKDLPRVYQFTADGRLLIRPARPDERWSVTWERY